MQASRLSARHLVVIIICSKLSPYKVLTWQIITKNKHLDDSIHFAPYYAFNYVAGKESIKIPTRKAIFKNIITMFKHRSRREKCILAS